MFKYQKISITEKDCSENILTASCNVNNISHMDRHSATNPHTLPNILLGEQEPVFEIVNANGTAPIVFVCEHAANRIPNYFAGLGLGPKERQSHIAWDPGARNVALTLSKMFDAPLVCSTISRLIYDCNRPPDAPGAMQSKSENTLIPGNKDISADEAQARIEQVYDPFVRALKNAIGQKINKGMAPVLITVHSFTPIYFGKQRDVEIGVLHDSDSRLADAMLALHDAHTPLNIGRNSPYGPEDGVTHTLREHGVKNGLINVMLEIRNDLIKTPGDQQAMAGMLARWLGDALAGFGMALRVAGPVKLTTKEV